MRQRQRAPPSPVACLIELVAFELTARQPLKDHCPIMLPPTGHVLDEPAIRGRHGARDSESRASDMVNKVQLGRDSGGATLRGVGESQIASMTLMQEAKKMVGAATHIAERAHLLLPTPAQRRRLDNIRQCAKFHLVHDVPHDLDIHHRLSSPLIAHELPHSANVTTW